MLERRQVDEAWPSPAAEEHRVDVLSGQLHGRPEAAATAQAAVVGLVSADGNK